MTNELPPIGTMPEAQLTRVESYVNAQRQITDRRRALEAIFGQEMMQYNNGIFTDINTTIANLEGIVQPNEIRLVDNSRNCSLYDDEGNFLPDQNLVYDLSTYGLHSNCLSCRWGIDGDGGHNTGCPRLELTAPLYLELDRILRPEPIHMEMQRIKHKSIYKLVDEIDKAKTAQEAYTILSQPCPDTGLSWYRYTFGIIHMGTYMNLPVSIYHNEKAFREQYEKDRNNKQFNLLDIGCGEGTLTKRLANIPSDFSVKGIKRRMFDRVIGLDINAGMIRTARKNKSTSNLEYIAGNVSKLPPIKFDAVVFNGLSPYLNYNQAVELTESLKSILTDRGRIYTSLSISNGLTPQVNKYLQHARTHSTYNCTKLTSLTYKVLQLAARENPTREIDFKRYLSQNGFEEQEYMYLDMNNYPTLEASSVGVCLIKQ